MNEEAIQQAYNDAVAGGYNVAIDDFKILLSTNEEFVILAYNTAKNGGYTDTLFDFRTLMGVDAPRATVKKKEEEVVVEEEVGVSPAESSSSELPTDGGQIETVGENKGVPVYDDSGEIAIF